MKKMEITNIMKNTYAGFLRYEIAITYKSAITYKCGRVVLFLTSVFFAISKLVLLFSYSFHVPCIILSNVYFYIVQSMFPFLFNSSQSKASVDNQRVIFFFFEAQKYFFALLQMVIFTTLFRR